MPWVKRLNPLNFLAGKIFLWFWLLIVMTMLSMLIVTAQVTPGIQDQPIPQHVFEQIKSMEEHLNRVSRRSGFSLQRFLHSPRFGSRRHVLVQIGDRNSDSRKLLSNRPLPATFDKQQLPLDSNDPVTVLQGDFIVYGPFELTIAQQSLRLFTLRLYKPHPMTRFRMLPPWIRFGVPLLISAVASFFMATSLVNPIRKLRNAHRELAQGNLESRSNGVALRNDELGQLGQDFDDMAVKISQLLAAQKRLLGDVSHELRSPLTRMQIALGLALQPHCTDLPRHLQRIELEANRLDDMIGEVLRLSRLESQLQSIEMFPLSLPGLLEYLIKDADFEAQQNNKNVSLHSTSQASVMGDQALLASAFENVIRNAVKYTDEQTVVTVTLKIDATEVIVKILDSGPGVPASALSQLFQPFYRVSDSRQRSSGGTGLGLAIAEKSIRSHGGSIVAHNHQLKGLEITVKLPLYARQSS
ncbi:MAG: two-component system sensor histidine kinase CpxA [Alteromonadaceae bacterium]|jgi:two-component system sensor histidine kinase CpxA